MYARSVRRVRIGHNAFMADRDICPPRKEENKWLEKIKNAKKEPTYPPPLSANAPLQAAWPPALRA